MSATGSFVTFGKTTLDKGAVLIDSVLGMVTQRGIRCIVKTQYVEIESKHGTLNVPTNKIVQMDFFPHYKTVLFWKIDSVEVRARTIDGSLIKGRLITTGLQVGYPNGIVAGENEVDCTKLKHIVGKQL